MRKFFLRTKRTCDRCKRTCDRCKRTCDRNKRTRDRNKRGCDALIADAIDAKILPAHLIALSATKKRWRSTRKRRPRTETELPATKGRYFNAVRFAVAAVWDVCDRRYRNRATT